MTTDTTSKVPASKHHTSHERRVSAVIVIKLIPVLKTLKQQIIFGHDTTGINKAAEHATTRYAYELE